MPNGSQRANKRDEIIEVASRLFYENGFHHTGVQQIIQEADAAKGTFYSHFKSKEDLGVAWLRGRHLTWNGWLQDAIGPKKTARGKLLGMFDFLGEWMEGADYRGCAFINTLCETPDRDSVLRDEVSQHKREFLELFRSLVSEHHASKSASEQKHIATTLFLLFEGALIQLQNFKEAWPLEVARKQATALLQR